MRKSNTWGLLFTLSCIVAAIFALLPSIQLYRMPQAEQRQTINENPLLRKKIVNLGLDLQGGMRLVLEVQRDETNQDDEDLLDRAYTIVENRINGLGLTEPIIQKQGRDRLIVELPGLNDEKIAKEVLGSTAQLKFHVLRTNADFETAVQTIDNVLKSEIRENTDTTAQVDSLDNQNIQLAESIFSGSEIESKDPALLAEEKLANDNDIEEETIINSLSDYLLMTQGDFAVREKDKATVNAILERPDVIMALRQNGFSSSHFAWGNSAITDPGSRGRYIQLFFLKNDAAMSGENVEAAQPDISRDPLSNGASVVSIGFNSEGAREFEKVTGRNINERLAIVLDGFVYSAPTINDKISGGNAIISGSFTMVEAKALAVVLQAGALPAPVEIIEERTIGPSLGHDSIVKASYAALIGFILVAIYILMRYKLSGIVAIVGVMLNVLFVLAIMAALGATLTLPGIAGIILIMGMAVDANVIIFERIREELRLGKGVITAIESGYDRAFRAIFDANITTFFTAFVLYSVGSGPIRGFALTMMIGILVSLFTALTFTKMVFRLATTSGKVKKLSI